MAVNYVLVFSDPADADLEQMNISLNRRDPDYAVRWEDGLSQALQDLLGFPGPLSHARDEEASVHYSREVRRMLYYGPTKRRSVFCSLFCRLRQMSRRKPPKLSSSCCACFTGRNR